MPTVRFKHRGNFNKLERFLKRVQNSLFIQQALDHYGEIGVEALSAATPKDSGLTSGSWGYQTSKSKGVYRIEWTNSNENDGYLVAILIQYGHGLPQGGYVQPTDYINPAMVEVFQTIADDAWTEVTSA